MPALMEPIGPVAPTEEEATQAEESSRLLRSLGARPELQVQARGARHAQKVVLPPAAVRLLIEMLAQMAQGHAITLIPIHAELTTQQAANLLNVSRPFLVKLLEHGRIPFRKVGKHRRIQFRDVLAFREQSDAERRDALKRLVAEAEELGLGY